MQTKFWYGIEAKREACMVIVDLIQNSASGLPHVAFVDCDKFSKVSIK